MSRTFSKIYFSNYKKSFFNFKITKNLISITVYRRRAHACMHAVHAVAESDPECPPTHTSTQLPPVIVEPAELEPSQEPAAAEDEVDVTSRDTDIWRRVMPVVDLRRLSS